MDCKHENQNIICTTFPGGHRERVECDTTVSVEPCPEAGTWPEEDADAGEGDDE